MRFVMFFLMVCLATPVTALAQIRINGDLLDQKIQLDPTYIPNYRDLMRDIVTTFSEYAKNVRPSFKIIAQNGLELLRRGAWENDLDDLHRAENAGAKTPDERFLIKLFSPDEMPAIGSPRRSYIQSVNGILATNHKCADDLTDQETQMLLKEYGISLLSVEHCSSNEEQNKALQSLAKKKIPAHADTDLKSSFDQINLGEKVFLENPQNIETLQDVRNILMMTNTRQFSDKFQWIDALAQSNYDLLMIDPFYKFNQSVTAEDVKKIQYKKMGARRLVFAVLNVAVAEDTRSYFQKSWKLGSPAWIRFASKTNDSGYTVDYWNPEWKRIMGIYFKSIMDLGFDGVVLQGLDNHTIFEKIIPIS